MIFQEMLNSIRSKTPKIIWGIIAAISIAILGSLTLPSVWFWICWEVAAAALVAVGCFGEWYLFRTAAKSGHEEEHRRRELQFILAVAIGVTMEFFALPHAMHEAFRLENQVAEANVRAKHLESTNLVMRSNVVALERQLFEMVQSVTKLEEATAPRSLGDQAVFANVLKQIPGIKVRLINVQDAEARDLASQLALTLQWGDWKLDSQREVQQWFSGISIVKNSGSAPKADRSRAASLLLLNALIGQGLASTISANPDETPMPVDTIMVVIGRKPDIDHAKSMVILSKILLLSLSEEGPAAHAKDLDLLWESHDRLMQEERKRLRSK